MATASRRVIVAGMPAEAAGRPDLVALYPDETTPGAPFSWERVYGLSGLSSKLFRELVAVLAPGLEKSLGLPPAAAATLAREAIVPLTHFYFNRLLRLEALLAREPGAAWAVAAAPPPVFPARAEGLMSAAVASPLFNQQILVRLAKLRGLEVVDSGFVFPDAEPVHASAKIFVNRNFAPSTLPQKLKRLALTVVRRLGNRRGLIATLSMSYAMDALKNAGFFASYLASLRGALAFRDAAPDPEKRRVLRELLAPAAGPVGEFLAAAGSSFAAREAVFADYVDFAVAAYPSSVYEGASANLELARAALRPYASRPLLLSERGDLESAVMIAAAKTMGMKIVGSQHGGHGGFMADLAVALEVEHYHCDGYITWGWSRLSAYPPPPPQPIKIYDLPSPFLSERARLWRTTLERGDAQRRFDVLYLSNGVHRFTTAPGCAGQSNIDFIQDCSKMLVDLAGQARLKRVSLLHKPRDPRALVMLDKTFASMREAGGEYYHCFERYDKGMTKELLDQCRVVVWDQPGMGFQELLAAGVPTMCYWPRIYNREDPQAAAHVAALEATGVIHRTTDGLFSEVEKVKAFGGRAWLAEPARARAVADFAHAYCRADDDWARRWTAFFDGL